MPKSSSKLFIISCVVFGVGGLSGGALGVVWIYIERDFNLSLSAYMLTHFFDARKGNFSMRSTVLSWQPWMNSLLLLCVISSSSATKLFLEFFF